MKFFYFFLRVKFFGNGNKTGIEKQQGQQNKQTKQITIIILDIRPVQHPALLPLPKNKQSKNIKHTNNNSKL